MGKKKKLFVVSDIHGYCTLLKNELDKVGFDRNNEDHLLICCGDYFDRGPENLQVLKFIELVKNKVILRGNHEDMLLEIFDTGRIKDHNYINGTVETLVEFFGKYAIDTTLNEIDFSGKSRILDRVSDFIYETADFFETKNYVFTHGWLPTVINEGKPCIDKNWRNASREKWLKARWTKWTDMYENCDRLADKTIVCGHVPSFYASKFDKSRDKYNSDVFYGKGIYVVDAGTFTSANINVLALEDELL
ncbi:MAG: hypothetical protein E7562_04895 [Ruminococcaceae bacterium]|nr:hypothetical protein [Oscillospiraceae bacterium]